MRLVHWLLSPIVRLLELCLYKLAEAEEVRLVEEDTTPDEIPPVRPHTTCVDAWHDGAGYTCPPCAALLAARMPKEAAA